MVEDVDRNDLGSLCRALGSITIKQAQWHKNDPRVYFKKLTNKSIELMDAMAESHTVCSGSRASAYFYNDASSADSDWDFYCSAGAIGVSVFIYRLSEMGATWLSQPKRGDVQGNTRIGFYEDFHVLDGMLENSRIQIIWSGNSRAFSSIVGFHSSITQCFISAHCAVSMYHNISSKGKSIKWNYSPETQLHRIQSAPSSIDKYEKRGFKSIDYNGELIGAYSPEFSRHRFVLMVQILAFQDLFWTMDAK